MAKFRKRTPIIDAVRYTPTGSGAIEYFNKMPDWLEQAYGDDIVGNVGPNSTESYLKIKLSSGSSLRADRGDWIIRDIDGEIRSCKADIFAAIYEPAE